MDGEVFGGGGKRVERGNVTTRRRRIGMPKMGGTGE